MTLNISPETQQEADAAQKVLEIAREYHIESPEMMDAAASELKSIKAKAKDLESRRMAMTRPLDDTKKQIMDFFRLPLQYLLDAENIIKRGMLAYQGEQERLRRAEEARLRDLAEKERQRLERQAAKADEQGKAEKAEDLREQAESLPVPVVAHSAPQVAGISTRENWSAEVTDMRALLQGVIDGKVPEVAVIADMKVLNAQARALKSAMNYPGVKAVCEKGISARV